ncbi:DNA glycosylase AlkZ-like family protein [Phycicoccus sp. HDW14]|uniref:DNA glycosylase AlkZ-like family protein n=1 Tax=Phycicoccus sp. HDW14 TaxID=2714941 RepID=UPI0035301F30
MAAGVRARHRGRPGLVARRHPRHGAGRAGRPGGRPGVTRRHRRPGWLLPDDLDPVDAPDPWAALLPTLDPTVMGWRGRGPYLGGHGPALVDAAGNAGTTAWWDGRVVGCWVQGDDARVRVGLLDDVPATGRRALDAEAERLTAWLDGVRVTTIYASPAMREVAG